MSEKYYSVLSKEPQTPPDKNHGANTSPLVFSFSFEAQVRASVELPSDQRPRLPFSSLPLLQDACGSASHHICIPGRKKRKREDQNVLSSFLLFSAIIPSNLCSPSIDQNLVMQVQGRLGNVVF